MQIRKGSVVKSKAGHDKGYFFVVVDLNSEYAVICDGKHRPLEKTKKKKFKHLFATNTVLSKDLLETNRKIRKELSKFI